MKTASILLGIIAIVFVGIQLFSLKSQKNIETYPYVVNKKFDSALYYSNKGLIQGFMNNDNFQYYRFLSHTGEILYYKNELTKAHDSIVKAFPFETSHNAQFNNHFILGNIFKKQSNDIKALYHFSKADSIYNLTMDVVPEVREIQEYFINYYKSKDDIKNQLKYIDRLLHVDSIIHSNHINLSETIFKKYDTPLLLSEKQELITHIEISIWRWVMLIPILLPQMTGLSLNMTSRLMHCFTYN